MRWLVELPSLASLYDVPPYLRLQVFDLHKCPACSSVHPEQVQSNDKDTYWRILLLFSSQCTFVAASTSVEVQKVLVSDNLLWDLPNELSRETHTKSAFDEQR